MDKQQWQIIEPIIDRALMLDDLVQREKYIRLACSGDDKLYEEIIHLLQYIRKAEDNNFLES